MNEYLTTVLDAATNPELVSDEATRVRERLQRAGLLAPDGAPRARPDPAAFERARQAAAQGTDLSEIVSQDRR